jgi:transcriptional regulator with XRE-family HTH domain
MSPGRRGGLRLDQAASGEPVGKEELALVLTILRTVRGWNQEGLARASETGNSAISEYERGRKLPELATLERLLGAMGYPLAAVDHTRQFIAGLRARTYMLTAVPQPAVAGAPAPVGHAALAWEIEQATAELGRAEARYRRLCLLVELHRCEGGGIMESRAE